METNQNICPLFLSEIQKRDVSCKIAFFPLSDAVEAKHSSKLPASRWKNLKVKQMRQDVYKIGSLQNFKSTVFRQNSVKNFPQQQPKTVVFFRHLIS